MEKKLQLLKETILLGESLISEAKKIGIDKLPYGYDSLTRFIDEKTMDVHYNKHYKGYVKKLNDALSKKDYGNVELEDIIKSITRFPKTIRNNGGGAYNHSLFWKMLSPEKQSIKGEILTKINKEFGSFKEFKVKFEEEALGRFGSGWVWLVLTNKNRLKIMTTANQDNPQMNDIDGGGYPLLGLDVWEHAYYLKYQSKRDEYVKKFWDVVNWEFVNEVYKSELKSKLKESITSKKITTEPYKIKNYILNELQLQKLYESLDLENKTENKSKIYDLCSEGSNNTFCKYISEVVDKVSDENIKRDNLAHFDELYRIVDDQNLIEKLLLFLLSNKLPIQAFEVINNFMKVGSINRNKKVLIKFLKETGVSMSNLLYTLKNLKEPKSEKYEKDLAGDNMVINRTKLQIDFRCKGDKESPDYTTERFFVNVIKKIMNNTSYQNEILKMTNCILKDLKNSKPIKADLKSVKDLTYNGKVVFPKGSYFEVKYFEVGTETFLSEFFAIFKSSKLASLKTTDLSIYKKMMDVYNDVTNQIFDKIVATDVDTDPESFLSKIKSNMSGVFFQNFKLVPIENVTLFWSKQGQRNENRLSVRVALKKGEGTPTIYDYDPYSTELQLSK